MARINGVMESPLTECSSTLQRDDQDSRSTIIVAV